VTKERDLFVDTSVFIALRVRDDENHQKAADYMRTVKEKKLRLHTTNFILDEVYAYFSKNHAIAIEMAELIMHNPIITLHRISVDDEDQAWKILKKFSDKEFSYTDATSFAIMSRIGIKTAFAFDDHFSQYGKFVVAPA